MKRCNTFSAKYFKINSQSQKILSNSVFTIKNLPIFQLKSKTHCMHCTKRLKCILVSLITWILELTYFDAKVCTLKINIDDIKRCFIFLKDILLVLKKTSLKFDSENIWECKRYFLQYTESLCLCYKKICLNK